MAPDSTSVRNSLLPLFCAGCHFCSKACQKNWVCFPYKHPILPVIFSCLLWTWVVFCFAAAAAIQPSFTTKRLTRHYLYYLCLQQKKRKKKHMSEGYYWRRHLIQNTKCTTTMLVACPHHTIYHNKSASILIHLMSMVNFKLKKATGLSYLFIYWDCEIGIEMC